MVSKTSQAIATTVVVVALTASCGQEQTPPPETAPSSPAASTTNAPPRGTPDESSSSTSSTTPTTKSAEGRAATPPSTAKGQPRGKLPKPGSVDQRNAAAVAAAYVQTTETIDTRIDTSHNDAQRRALRWIRDDLAKDLEGDLPGGTGWADLKKRGAWTSVKVTDVTPAGGNPTEGLTTDRILQANVTTYGNDRKAIGKPTIRTTAVTLQRASATKPWRVTDSQSY